MTRRVWIRCFAVSLTLAVFMPLLMSLPFGLPDGTRTFDSEGNAVVLHGISRYTQWIVQPGGWVLYLGLAAFFLAICLVATLSVSYLEIRHRGRS